MRTEHSWARTTKSAPARLSWSLAEKRSSCRIDSTGRPPESLIKASPSKPPSAPAHNAARVHPPAWSLWWGGGWEEREGKEGFRKNGKKERNKKNKKVKGATEKKANEDR